MRIKIWTKKRLLNVVLALTLCLSVGFFVMMTNRDIDSAAKSGEPNATFFYAGTVYTVSDFTSFVRVFDPNGERVFPDENGKFTLTIVGQYKILHPDKTIIVNSLYDIPFTAMEFDYELEHEYPAGLALTLPMLTITNEVYNYDSYKVDIHKDGILVKTVTIKAGKAPLYLLPEAGRFVFNYHVITNGNIKESKTIATNVVDKKAVFTEDMPNEIRLGESVAIGDSYGFYLGKVYDTTVKLILRDGTEQAVTSTYFTPKTGGDYIFKYTSIIENETIVVSKTLSVTAQPLGLSVGSNNAIYYGKQVLPSYNTSAYTEGLLTYGSSSTVYYSDVVDLSSLTKEDNLLALLPYSQTNAFMTGLTVKFTDIYDTDNSITLYFMSSVIDNGVLVPHTYCTVLVGTKYYGMSNESKNNGIIRERHGTVAFNTSFRGADGGSSDAFSVQYDYATDMLYLTSRNSNTPVQYIYCPLSDKGEVPSGNRLDEQYWFKGFTTGEVIVSFETTSATGNAGFYLCELAGKTADELVLNEGYSEQTFIFDEYIESAPKGALGKAYIIPPVHYAAYYQGNMDISYSVEGPDGSIVAVKDGQFMPTAAGEHIVIYSGQDVTRTYTVEILPAPTPIDIWADTTEVEYGSTILPQVIVNGGMNSVSFYYKLFQADVELQPSTTGKYYIGLEGDITLKVSAVDGMGNEKHEEFTIPVMEGYAFVFSGELTKAVQAGTMLSIPSGTIYINSGGNVAEHVSNVMVIANNNPLPVTDGKFSVPKSCKTLQVKYTYGDYSKTIDVTVIDSTINSVSQYILTNTSTTKNIAESGIFLIDKTTIDVAMPYLISADNMIFTFGFNKNQAAFDSVDLFLIDSQDSAAQLKITFSDFNLDKATAKLYLNGGIHGYSLEGGAYTYSNLCGNAATVAKYQGTQYVLFSITVDTVNKSIIRTDNGINIASMTSFNDGRVFNGFTNTVAAVEFAANKTSLNEADFIVSQIGNHYFNYLNDISGYDNGDAVGPSIVIYGNKAPLYLNYGQTLTVPAAKAYDVLSGISDVIVTVRVNGTTISSNIAAEAFNISLDSYGYYSLIYSAIDINGRSSIVTVNIIVIDDVMPMLAVDGNYDTEVKVGKKIAILNYSASDAQGSVYTTIAIKDNQTGLTYVNAGDEYEFTAPGIYEIVYRAVDEANNITRVSFAIVVKG